MRITLSVIKADIGPRDEDADGNLVLVTGCDVCGRSEDQLDDF